MLVKGRYLMMKRHKYKIIIISLALLGILLIALSSMVSNRKSKEKESFSYEEYTSSLEEKIEKFLLSIDGIEKANVIVTLDTSCEQVYAQNQTTYDFLTVNSGDGESPVNITEIYPTVRGVAIACTNGENDEVKMKLTKLISAYLGISTNRIEIVDIK